MDEVLKKVKKQLSACEPDFAQFIGRLLSSFPEGENAIFSPVTRWGMGWREKEIIITLLENIKNGDDVRKALQVLFGNIEEWF